MNAINTVSLIAPVGNVGAGAQGPGLGGAETVFADSLAAVLYGSLAQPLVPVANPALTEIGHVPAFLSNGVGADEDSAGLESLLGQGGTDLFSPLEGLPGQLGDAASSESGPSPVPRPLQDLVSGDALDTQSGLSREAAARLHNLSTIQQRPADAGADLSLADQSGSLQAAGSTPTDPVAAQTLSGSTQPATSNEDLPIFSDGQVGRFVQRPGSAETEQILAQLSQPVGRPGDHVLTSTIAGNTALLSSQGSLSQGSLKKSAGDLERLAFGGQAGHVTSQQQEREVVADDVVTPGQTALNARLQSAFPSTTTTPSKPMIISASPTSVSPVDQNPTDFGGSLELSDLVSAEIHSLDSSNPGSAKPSAAANQPPSTQIAVHLTRAIPQGVDRFSIQLHPAELGAVEVRLDFAEDGRVSALITAERAETLDMLQRDSRALERSLNNTGLNLESGGLSFSLKQEQNQQGQGFNMASHHQANAYEEALDRDSVVNEPLERTAVSIHQSRLLDIRT